ncbi:MAG: IS5 family transposase [Planctomycetaceae bacterium]|jgi:IS5 family transposase
MRTPTRAQLQLGETDIADIQIDTRSRDDIPQLLLGLQHLYADRALREEIFELLAKLTPETVSTEQGRPGMTWWKILVMGSLRLNLNCDYDRLQELVNNHKTLRKMLGHGFLDDDKTYYLQTLKDNVQLFTPEILDEINQVVVRAGHKLKKKATLAGRCDSFVVETTVHYPTDINLLLDALRKVIGLTTRYAEAADIGGWRQSEFNQKQIKRAHRQAQQMKRSTSKDDTKKAEREENIVQAHRDYIDLAGKFIDKSQMTLAAEAAPMSLVHCALIPAIEGFIHHAHRQIDQIKRRVIEGEKIPHEEKVLSLFQPHTEWINKGKAGVPVELGLKVCVVEDIQGYLLHHRVMEKETDEQIAVELITQTQDRYPQLRVCSFDKGFHSPNNQIELSKQLDRLVLPKKGRCNKAEKDRESSAEFRRSRRTHSAVESAINALEVHGLDRCPDHGIDGFKRYVALAVVARNIQKLGAELQKKIQAQEKRKRHREKRAA